MVTWDDSGVDTSIDVDWDTLIRWGAVAVVLLLPVLTLWCLSRPVTWAFERWWP